MCLAQKIGISRMRRRRWVVTSCWVIWPVLVVVSMIYCKMTLDRIGGLGMVGTASQKGSTHSSSIRSSEKFKKDESFGGLLSPDFPDRSCLSRNQSILYRKPSPHTPSSSLISKFRTYESLHKRCAPFSKPYNETLKTLQSGPAIADFHCKYLVHLWISHSGLGNRLLSLASSFLYAILTDRVLLIDQGRETARLLCEPFPDTTWALPVDFPIRNLFESFDQNSPHCYGNKLRNKGRDASMDNKSDLPPFIYLNLIYDYGDYDKRFFCDSDQDLIRKVPWLVLRSDQYFIPSLFLISSFQSELRKLFPERGFVFHHLSRYLFHPSDHVWGLITRYYQAYLAKADQRIGIQIRDFGSTDLPFQSMKDHISTYYLPHLAVNQTNFNHIKDSRDLTSPLTFMMDRILDCSMQNNLLPKVKFNPQGSVFNGPKTAKSKAVLVTSLNSFYFDSIKNMYWENPTVTGEVIGVYQPSSEEYQQNHNPTHNMKALAEIYLLSLMDVLITSPWSTFGYVAQGLGGLKPWILNNPHKKMGSDQRPCHKATSIEPCFHFPPFYDCEARTESDTGKKLPFVRHCEDTSWGLKLFDDH